MATPNFSEIAARVAAASDDVRSCLIVSQDGLTLGVFPEEGEDGARAAWGRMVASGDPEPERGFLTVGEEVWAFTRRAGYGALATADRGARPGLLLDALDGALKEAHQERVETAPTPAPAKRVSEPATPATRTRTPAAHAEPRGAEPRRPERRAAPKPNGPPVPRVDPSELEQLQEEEVEVEMAPAAKAPAKPAPRPKAAPPPQKSPPLPGPAPRVDTVELTREFGGLFDGPGSR